MSCLLCLAVVASQGEGHPIGLSSVDFADKLEDLEVPALILAGAPEHGALLSADAIAEYAAHLPCPQGQDPGRLRA